MSDGKDGGPAFACANETDHQPGMPLRDFFAGQALAGLCACADYGEGWGGYASDSYTLSDAMLAERAKVRP